MPHRPIYFPNPYLGVVAILLLLLLVLRNQLDRYQHIGEISMEIISQSTHTLITSIILCHGRRPGRNKLCVLPSLGCVCVFVSKRNRRLYLFAYLTTITINYYVLFCYSSVRHYKEMRFDNTT